MMRTLGFSAMVVYVRVKGRIGYKVCVVFRKEQVGVVESAIDPAQCGEGESEKLLCGRAEAEIKMRCFGTWRCLVTDYGCAIDASLCA